MWGRGGGGEDGGGGGRGDKTEEEGGWKQRLWWKETSAKVGKIVKELEDGGGEWGLGWGVVDGW